MNCWNALEWNMTQNTWIDWHQRFWHPSGKRIHNSSVPVVALRLPPANLSNRFAVNHTKDYNLPSASR